MPLIYDQKFSTFLPGGALVNGDIIVGLRGGLNTQFNWTYTGFTTTVTGTANQVLVNGTSGSPESGAVTLTTPQNLDVNTAFQVNTLRFNSNNGILDSNGKEIISFIPAPSAVNYLTIGNAITPAISTFHPLAGSVSSHATNFLKENGYGRRRGDHTRGRILVHL